MAYKTKSARELTSSCSSAAYKSLIPQKKQGHFRLFDFGAPVDMSSLAGTEPLFAEIVSTRAFQRLLDIRFLGAIDYLLIPNPNGTSQNQRFTRYQHSLGVAHLALLYARITGLSAKRRRLAYTAALLHDIGHGPLSHTLEPLYQNLFGIDHHEATKSIISGKSNIGSDLIAALKRHSLDPDEIIDVLSGGSNAFSGFFSGPINFDTIEAISRSRKYLAPNTISPSPISVLRSAIRRSSVHDRDVVDGFWMHKQTVYKHIVRSREGVLIDNVCRVVASCFRGKLSANDYFIGERALFRKVPGLIEAIRLFPRVKSDCRQLSGPVRFTERLFRVNDEADFFRRDDKSRYLQTKRESTIYCSYSERPLKHTKHGDVNDAGIRTGKDLF